MELCIKMGPRQSRGSRVSHELYRILDFNISTDFVDIEMKKLEIRNLNKIKKVKKIY